jgi:hypothetical protein
MGLETGQTEPWAFGESALASGYWRGIGDFPWKFVFVAEFIISA